MKKPIFYLLIFSLTVLAFTVNAQDVSLGVRGGLSIPNLSSGNSTNPLNSGYSSRVGGDFGIFADFKISKLFSLQPMLEYSQQGGIKNGYQAFPTPPSVAAATPPGYPVPPYLWATFNNTSKINYLMLPILAKFGWDFKAAPIRFYIDAGPFLALLASAHQITSGSSQVYADEASTQPASNGPQSFNATTDIKDQLHSANVGVEANIGFAYKMKKSALFIEGGFNYGFINIQKGTANGKNNTGAGTVAVGYSFAL
jgi:hypothetical protein